MFFDGARRDDRRRIDVDLAAVALAPVLAVDTNDHHHRTWEGEIARVAASTRMARLHCSCSPQGVGGGMERVLSTR